METIIGTIRAGGQKAGSAKGEPALLIGTTSNYAWLYSDVGSGAKMDVTIYRPSPISPGWSIIGDYAQGDYGNPSGTSLIVQAVNDPTNSLLASPVGYTEVWNDHGSGGDNDGSIWFPVPPEGYVTIGFVGQTGYNMPNIPNYVCVRQDLATATTVGGLIWNDHGSGASGDVALYQNNGVSGAFVAQPNYNPPTINAFAPIGQSAK